MCSVDVKIVLFRSYCTHLYTAHLWSNYKNKSINDFYIAYHNIIKLFIGHPKWEHNRPICVHHNIPYGPALIRNYIYRFICRLNESQNVLIVEVVGTRWPSQILFRPPYMDVFSSIFYKNDKHFGIRKKMLYYPSNFPQEYTHSLKIALIMPSNFYFLSYQTDFGIRMTRVIPTFQRYVLYMDLLQWLA